MALSTRAGLSTAKEEIKEVAAPYLKMDTKELVGEGAKLINTYAIQPVKEKAAPYVAPYVEKAKEKATPYVEKAQEKAAPYISKGLDTKDAVMKDERVQKAVAALKDKFAAVRERPADVVADLKTTAVDLIKYEKIGEYRAYVCSETFVSDTMRLVKEDLPALAKDATLKGASGVKAGAELMKEELAHASALAKDAWKKGREEHADLRSWEALTGLARLLITEISTGALSRAEEYELKEKLTAMVGRLKTVFGLAEPAEPAALAPPAEPAPEAAAADVDDTDDDEKFEDAPLSPEKSDSKTGDDDEAPPLK